MDVGATLRQAREDKGLTLEHLSRATRITLPILTAIEQNDRSAIPPRPYGRGFVRAYASEVGLDADQVAREFFGQFAAPPEPPAEPANPRPVLPAKIDARVQSLRPVFLVVVVIFAAIAAVALFVREPRPGGTPHAAGTSGRSQPALVASSGTTTPAPQVGLTISLLATEASWVTAHADGRRVLYRILQAGEREVVRADREITIRTGNAGALRWQVDGSQPAPMGRPGEVRTVRLTAHHRQP